MVRIRDSMIFFGEVSDVAKAWPAMERSGAVEDPSGNQWWISTHIEDMSESELIQRALNKDG